MQNVTIHHRGMGHAEGRGYWLTRLMGTLRFTHPTKTYVFCRMGEGAQRRTHQSVECRE